MSANVGSPKATKLLRSESASEQKPGDKQANNRQDYRNYKDGKIRQDFRRKVLNGNQRQNCSSRENTSSKNSRNNTDNKRKQNDNKNSRNERATSNSKKRTNSSVKHEQSPHVHKRQKIYGATTRTTPLIAEKINEVKYLETPPLQFLGQVGQGTYGKVYKVVDQQTHKTLAMKGLRLPSYREGFPVVAAREIKLLQILKHPNIVELNEVIISKSEIYMALEYIDHDLAGLLLNDNLLISPANAKSLIKQILCALDFLHTRQVLHRDLKGSNILVTNDGTVKLADFGLARQTNYSVPNVRYTNRVISLWYRPPELLLGEEHYAAEVDIWSAGCLLVEIFNRSPLFKATEEVSQMLAIYAVMGIPTPKEWPEHEQLPWYHLIHSLPTQVPAPTYKFHRVFRGENVTPACFELASQLLQMNPLKRLDAASALKHLYFLEHPQERKLNLKMEDEWHDWEAKNRKRNDMPLS